MTFFDHHDDGDNEDNDDEYDDDNDDDNEDENSNGNDLIHVFPAVKQLSLSDHDYIDIFHGDGAVCI